MFTHTKHTTVASIMETFRASILDLEKIITQNLNTSDKLRIRRIEIENTISIINEDIEDTDLQVIRARVTIERLQDLISNQGVTISDS